MIVAGDSYLLMYYDGTQWKEHLPIVYAGKNYLDFTDVPVASLYLLRNLTNGKEELPFFYRNGKQYFLHVDIHLKRLADEKRIFYRGHVHIAGFVTDRFGRIYAWTMLSHTFVFHCMYGVVILFAGLYAACFVRTDRFRFALPDLFAGIVAIVAAGCYLKYPGLLSLGSLCLPVLYVSIRRTGKIYPFLLLYGAAITLVLLSLYGYLQYFRLLPSHSSYFPVTGPYHNPAVYAGVMTILLSVLMPYLGSVAFRRRQRKGVVRGIIAAVLLAVPVLLLTEARVAWVALGVSVAYTFFCAYRHMCASFSGNTAGQFYVPHL